ncbi:unnamed protein product [Cercospora beticola]|nr:unnamed protein product [Cercospora beticola]
MAGTPSRVDLAHEFSRVRLSPSRAQELLEDADTTGLPEGGLMVFQPHLSLEEWQWQRYCAIPADCLRGTVPPFFFGRKATAARAAAAEQNSSSADAVRGHTHAHPSSSS